MSGPGTQEQAFGGRILAELVQWLNEFEAGSLSDRVVGPGERFAIRVPGAAAVDLDIELDRVRILKELARGDVVATDRRLMVVQGTQVRHAWSWTEEVERASAMRDGIGVGLLPSQQAYAQGRLLTGVVSTLYLKRRPRPSETLPLIYRWHQVAGAWYVSRGEGQAWVAEMRKLLLAP